MEPVTLCYECISLTSRRKPSKEVRIRVGRASLASGKVCHPLSLTSDHFAVHDLAWRISASSYAEDGAGHSGDRVCVGAKGVSCQCQRPRRFGFKPGQRQRSNCGKDSAASPIPIGETEHCDELLVRRSSRPPYVHSRVDQSGGLLMELGPRLLEASLCRPLPRDPPHLAEFRIGADYARHVEECLQKLWH